MFMWISGRGLEAGFLRDDWTNLSGREKQKISVSVLCGVCCAALAPWYDVFVCVLERTVWRWWIWRKNRQRWRRWRRWRREDGRKRRTNPQPTCCTTSQQAELSFRAKTQELHSNTSGLQDESEHHPHPHLHPHPRPQLIQCLDSANWRQSFFFSKWRH